MGDKRIALQKIERVSNGITPSYQGSISTGDVHQVNNNGKVFIQFKKANAVDCTVTFTTPGSLDGNAVADYAPICAASGGDIMVGPFDPAIYNKIGTHDLEFAVSNIDGLTLGAFLLEG